MSLPTSPSSSLPSLVLSSPDRVLVRAIPHSLASTNKRVTLSSRRSPPAQPTPASLSLTSTSLFDTPPQGALAIAVSEPLQAPINMQSPNTHRRTPSATILPPHDFAASPIIQTPALTSKCVPAPALGSTQPLSSSKPTPFYSSHHVSVESHQTCSPTTISTTAATQSSPLRRPTVQILHKNGLPVKSALKSPAIVVDIKTSPVMALCRPSSIRSHSSPSFLTSPKYVHFNTQLEHVRLFLQGEMPSCVADRETIVDSRQDNRNNSDIKLTLPNWTPVAPGSFEPGNIDAGAAPLRMEKADLSEDQTKVLAKILVQNIAFHKHVSVRYTIDFWQTQSEVRAEFEESIPGTSLDRFAFEIPLEMERSNAEKTFCFAVRYQVIGREFWDSNNGMNYQIECKRVVVATPPAAMDLSKQMNSLLLGSSPVNDYSKPAQKKLANRYDLSTSLSAAYSHPNGIQARAISLKQNNPSALSAKITTSTVMGTPVYQSAYRPSEYITPVSSSPLGHDGHSLYASSPKFINPYLSAASPPEHFHLGFDQFSVEKTGSVLPKGVSRNHWNVDFEPSPPSVATRSQSFPSGYYGSYSSSPKASAPISIPTARTGSSTNRPAVGSSSYFDLVDRYCFYESSPHTSPYSSYPNSPPAPCIRG